jgi:hypothetical protein
MLAEIYSRKSTLTPFPLMPRYAIDGQEDFYAWTVEQHRGLWSAAIGTNSKIGLSRA